MAEGYLDEALREVAEDACGLAAEKAGEMLSSLKGGRDSFYPVVRGETVGVGVNPEYHYLIYQENGFASFTMTACFGKTIPMVIDGRLVFRKCTGLNQFRPGFKTYWVRGQDGELVPEYRQRRAWVHPGLPPKNFMRDAVAEAVERNRDLIDEAYLRDAYESVQEDIDRIRRR